MGGLNMKLAFSTNIFHRYTEQKKRLGLKIMEFIVFFIIFIFFCGVLYQFIASEMDKSQYKMKGKMFSVGSYRLMANTTGSGKYSIIFESDIGTPIQQWNTVKEELSKDYRVFSYERNGYGWSDSSGEKVDIPGSVSDLRKILTRAGIPAPYILVGHGYGGLIMTEFARKYPQDVAGLVLVDSLTEENIKSEEFQMEITKKIAKIGVSRFFSYSGGIRIAHKLKILKDKEEFLKNLTEAERELFHSQKVTSKYYAAYYNELKELKGYEYSIQKEDILEDKFVEILTPAHKFAEDEKDKAYVEQQKQLEKLSSKAEQAVVERSGSYIHIDRPDAIVNAVNRIVKKAGKL
jgi:pimeloyl-ACP methyl ester carboxylesterase